MRVGAFEVEFPVPNLKEPHAIAVVPSWLDAGKSATLTLSYLERLFGGQNLTTLARPGEFFDQTRYRPVLSGSGDSTRITITNAVVAYGRRTQGSDFVFLQLPEPHTRADDYVDSVTELLKTIGLKRYILLGSVYDMVPYTRPMLVTSSASNQSTKSNLSVTRVVPSDYQGPTSILSVIV